MGIGRIIGGTVAGLGMVGLGYTGIAGQDDTTRDETGDIVEEGEVGAFRIRVGDCLNGFSVGLIESMEGVPCTTAHEVEAYHAFNLPDGPFPGDTAVGEQAADGCYNAFEPFVGKDYETSIYDIRTMTPTPESWAQLDDREIVCFINNYDGTLKTGSAQGTGL